jgi:hypothetical protein
MWLLFAAAAVASGVALQDVEPGFVRLFDGCSLDGWVIMGDPAGWSVCGGVIHSDGGKGGGWIRTEEQYDDFILRLEWKVSEGGNSGVFLRYPMEGDPWISGHEVQITNESRDTYHCTGSLYGTVAASPRPDESPCRWHTYEIRCEGKHITVIVDGLKCVSVSTDWAPGARHKPLRGYIGLQDSHTGPGGTIDFRNIRIKRLP